MDKTNSNIFFNTRDELTKVCLDEVIRQKPCGKYRILTFLFALLFMASCDNIGTGAQDPEIVTFDTICSCPERLVYILPYDNEAYFAGLSAELQKNLDELMPEAGYNVEPLPEKPLPQSAYYAPRNRYRADIIIALQREEYKNNDDMVVIGVTRKDISCTVHGQKDYGIMGLSYKPGNSCVVSSYRIPERKNLHKVVLHEFLHSRGLPHCPKDDPRCYMKDAKGKGNVAKQKYLCEACKKTIKRIKL